MRELIRSNQSSNIKDRLSIQLDYTPDKDDMRNGIITVDTLMYKSRVSFYGVAKYFEKFREMHFICVSYLLSDVAIATCLCFFIIVKNFLR